jgi:hypothetical protein
MIVTTTPTTMTTGKGDLSVRMNGCRVAAARSAMQDVPPGGNPTFRFFTVEVELP